MDHTVTLTIPEETYRTAEATAHQSNQSVDQVLSNKLTEAFQPLPTLHASPNRAGAYHLWGITPDYQFCPSV